MGRAKQNLRAALVQQTLDNARDIPFYRRLWEPVDTSAATLDTLRDLPLVTKGDVQDAGTDAMRPGEAAARLIHTSGTTSEPFVRYRGETELAAIRDYDLARYRRAKVPVTLLSMVGEEIHAGSVGTPAGPTVIRIRPFDETGLTRVAAIMRRRPVLPGSDSYVVLVGSPNALLLLSAGLAYVGVAPDGLGLAAVSSLSDYLSPVTAEYLSRAYAAPVMDSFSMSEVYGGASVCAGCGHFHFEPTVVPHAVGLDGTDEVETGLGRLTLTELMPFSQLQPLIRYVTGDVVEVARGCPEDDFGFRYVGRTSMTPMVRVDGRLVVPVRPVELRKVLDARPDVARADVADARFPSLRGLELGAPRADLAFDAAGTSPEVKVTVAAGFSPSLFPDRATGLADAVRAGLAAAEPGLEGWVASGALRLDVSVVPRGRLDTPLEVIE